MRISDWSSDVCSSDLHALLFGIAEQALLAFARRLVGRRRWTRRCRLGSRSGRGRRFGFDLWRLGLAGLAQHTPALDQIGSEHVINTITYVDDVCPLQLATTKYYRRRKRRLMITEN